MSSRLIGELYELELQLANVSGEERTPILNSMQQILLTLKREHVEMLGQIEQVLRRINSQLDNNFHSPFNNKDKRSSVGEKSPDRNYGQESGVKENDLLNKINKLVNQLDDFKQNTLHNNPHPIGFGGGCPLGSSSSEISTIAYLAKYNLCDENIKKPLIIDKNNSERIFKTPPGRLLPR
jgi:hypothetical protein